MLNARGWKVAFPQRTFATVDHIVPTRERQRPFLDVMAEQMMSALERNCVEHGIPLYNIGDAHQGIVHVIGPELGLTQPGMTIACGDSHTSTHGAFGSVAFGIGTSQVRDVLASQCLALEPLQVRRIDVTGRLAPGVYAKDVILEIIRQLGVKGGAGYAYEYGGPVVDRMSMDERMTICNMSIEGAARVGYVNPDDTTFAFLEGRAFAPQGEAFDRASTYWRGLASDADARYDDRVTHRRRRARTHGDLGDQPRPVGADQRTVARSARGRRPGSRRRRRGVAVHELRRGRADQGHAHRRGVHRVLHEQPPVGPARGGQGRARPSRRAAREGPGRARLGHGAAGRRARRAARDLPRRRLRVARRRLLDVPGDEPRPAPGPRGVRQFVESQLQGAPGQPHGAHVADVAGDGRRRRGGRRGRRRPARARQSRSHAHEPQSHRTCHWPGVAASRPRHRHRSHHPRALPQVRLVRGTRAARVRR